MPVTIMRIDDRLIHGQIITRWIAEAQADMILVADNQAAIDPTQQMLLKLVTPANIELQIKSIEDAVQLLILESVNCKKILLMVRNPESALKMQENGLSIDTINVGNISNTKSVTGRKKLLPFIFVEEQDVVCLRGLAKAGIKLDVRAVPNDKSIDAVELLQKY